MRFNQVISIISAVVSLASCDVIGEHTYKIENKSSGYLKVTAIINTYPTKDTIITRIAVNETQAIGVVKLGLPPNNEKPDSLLHFIQLDVYKEDTTPAKTELRSAKYWNFHKDSRYFGTMTSTVTDADF